MPGSLKESAVDQEVIADVLARPHTCFAAHVSWEIPKNEGPSSPGYDVRSGDRQDRMDSFSTVLGPERRLVMYRWWRLVALPLAILLLLPVVRARAADTVNVYSIWTDNWNRQLFPEFEKATGIKVNFVRFSSGEALARLIAEKNNPRVDVLFGGPTETHAAGIKEGIFEVYKPPSFAVLPARFKDPEGQWVAIADNPLAFMSNPKFLKEHNLKPPASWNDLLHPAFKNMLQMADARTSGTAVTRLFSILEVYGRDEEKAFDYMKKKRRNVQLYTKIGVGGVLPVAMGQAAAGTFFIVDVLDVQAKGYDVTLSFPREGIGTAGEAIALIKGAKNPEPGKKMIDWATSPAFQSLFAKYQINFIPAHPDVKMSASLTEALKDAKIFPIDLDYAGANRKRIVERWVNEVLHLKE
jgi:iron(III) transport system substrate-binding protein